MALVLFHTKRVREALERRAGLGTDVLLIAGIAGLIAAVAVVFGQFRSNLPPGGITIDLSFAALPRYTLFSLARGFAAYALSLVFTLVYGTISAHNRIAEKVMLPALDVLQSIPVLGFLPGLVLGMVYLFPTREIGLELACVIMIFTGQAWNMTFSYHGTVRAIPNELREAAAISRLNGWQVFRWLEVPASMIGLVWNSMMSMAGGWFLLTVNEAFTLNGQDFRLPGLGAYMNEAINRDDKPAMVGGIVAMVLMIVAVDQLFWRPIVVWSQRYKLEDVASADVDASWLIDLFRRSPMLERLRRLIRRRHPRSSASRAPAPILVPASAKGGFVNEAVLHAARRAATWVILVGLAAAAVLGLLKIGRLMWALPFRDPSPVASWRDRQDWVTVVLALLASFARTTAAVLIGAAWTLPAGILIGRSPRWARRLQPVVQVLASFPAPMIFPLAYALLLALRVPFGPGSVLLMLLGTQWYILFNVIAGATAIPSQLVEAGQVYRFSGSDRWRRLYVPAVFPYLVTGLITAAGGAWNATIVSEYLAVKGQTIMTFGLGSMISQATAAGQYPLLTASIVAMSLFVVLLNRYFWKRLYRLSEQRYSLNL